MGSRGQVLRLVLVQRSKNSLSHTKITYSICAEMRVGVYKLPVMVGTFRTRVTLSDGWVKLSTSVLKLFITVFHISKIII